MVTSRSVRVWVLALCGLALWASPVPAQESPAQREASLAESATSLFNSGCFDLAAGMYQTLLRDFPQSKAAPENAYKLACAYQLQGKADDAKKAFADLVRGHFHSPWARLALLAHLDANSVYELAREKREQGRESRSAADCLIASQLFSLYGNRFAAQPGQPVLPGQPGRGKAEIAYKLSDCLWRAGQESAARTLLGQITANEPNTNWGKLAALRLADAKTFAARADELLALTGVDNEEVTCFLDLADAHLAGLSGADRAKGLYDRAYCLVRRDKKKEAEALLRSLVKEHAQSRWAAEAAFGLAEMRFADGDLAASEMEFRAAARQFPKHPRAECAARWADWSVHHEEACKALEPVVQKAVREIALLNNGIACNVEYRPEDGDKHLKGRLAYRGDGTAFLQVACRDFALLFVNSEQGTWLQSGNGTDVVRSRRKTSLPGLLGRVKDNGKGGISHAFNLNMLAAGPAAPGGARIEVDPAVAGRFLADIRRQAHIHREPPAKGASRTVFRFESPRWTTAQPDVWEVEVDAEQIVRALRVTSQAKAGGPVVLSVADIRVGAEVSDALFEAPKLQGVRVRDVESVNPYDVMLSIMSFASTLMQEQPAPNGNAAK